MLGLVDGSSDPFLAFSLQASDVGMLTIQSAQVVIVDRWFSTREAGITDTRE